MEDVSQETIQPCRPSAVKCNTQELVHELCMMGERGHCSNMDNPACVAHMLKKGPVFVCSRVTVDPFIWSQTTGFKGFFKLSGKPA